MLKSGSNQVSAASALLVYCPKTPSCSPLTLGILPAGAVSTMHAATTAATLGEGAPNDLSSPSDALSSVASAAAAAETAGSAAARSAAHSAWTAVTSAWEGEGRRGQGRSPRPPPRPPFLSLLTCVRAASSSSARPASAAASACNRSAPMDWMSDAVSADRAATTACSAASAPASSATWARAAAILDKPAVRRARAVEASSRLVGILLLCLCYRQPSIQNPYRLNMDGRLDFQMLLSRGTAP